jgi:uncharacterized protein YutE (UPF0331/DUF86 family)
MTPSQISKRVVVDRLAWVDQMIKEIQALPLNDKDAFFADRRNIWTVESCLRRGLEALFDLGRHILAKGFAVGVSEYKEIATGLNDQDILSPEEMALFQTMAGYRNRMVHFYHEIQEEELYDIASSRLKDLEVIAHAYRRWLRQNASYLDEAL